MVTLPPLKLTNIPQLKTYNRGLRVYVILAFSILVTSQLSFFQNESSLHALQPALQPQLIPLSPSPTPPPNTTIGQSQPSIQITAGKIQNLSFKIDLSNRNPGIINYPQSITDIAVFVSSQSSAVKIIGPTTWSLPRLDSNSSHLISTKVYASPSTIGNPVFFTVTVQYIKNGQELKTDSFDIGAVVIGDIKIEPNNLGIRYLGDTPNLVGNLLNKGNSGALFTNLQVLSVSLRTGAGDLRGGTNLLTGASQFLGTLQPNTPTPFSIPISIDLAVPRSGGNKINQSSNIVEANSSNNLESSSVTNSTINHDNTTLTPKRLSNAVYLVSLKITYNDELTNNHVIIVNSSIPYGLIDNNNSETPSASNVYGNSSADQSPQAQLDQLQQVSPEMGSLFNNGFVDAYWAENIPSSFSNSSSTGTSTASTSEVQIQRAVGPGEGPAILAVVLTNTAFSDITGITGYLTLPDGFSSLVPLSSSEVSHNENSKQNYPAIASISDIVKAGETYTLFFKVNILKTASVGLHSTTLRTYYFKTPDPEAGAYRVQTTSVPFVLAGKVVLDTSSSSTDLTPGEVNHVKIQIRNKGTADANNVVVTLNSAGGSIITSTSDLKTNMNNAIDVTGNILKDNLTAAPSSDQNSTSNYNIQQEASSLGSRIFNLGTIAANSAAEFDAAILPSFSAGESLQNLNLQVSYTDATGETKSSDEIVGFRVLPNLPEAGLSVNPNAVPQTTLNPTTSVEGNGANQVSPTNNDTGATSDSGLSVTPSGLASSMVTKNNYYQGISLAQNENRSNPINNRMNLTISTGDNLTSTQSSESLIKKASLSDTSNGIDNDRSIVKQDNNTRRSENNNIDDSITIIAGRESTLNFTITNNNRYPIMDAVVSLDSQSTSIAISGPSKWNLQRLDPGSHQFYSTTVFASTSIIGSPVSFEVGAQYIMNGRARNDTFNIGAKVIGEINVDVSNIAINSIAGTPNLIGNLLNKGNTVALFTTIQLLSPGNSTDQNQNQSLQNRHPNPTISQSSKYVNSQKSSVNGSSSQSSSDLSVDGLVPVSTFPSYLGDLDANSPLPFSIPLELKNNSSPGRYQISLRITYSDDLRADHALIINSSVDLTRPRQRSGDNGDQNQGILGILIGKQNSLKIGGISLPIPLLLIIVAIALALLILRRRRRLTAGRIYAASKSSSKEDQFFLDGKGNKDQGTISKHTSLENERSKGSGTERRRGLDEMNKEEDDSGEKK
jgi:hypothetical protein